MKIKKVRITNSQLISKLYDLQEEYRVETIEELIEAVESTGEDWEVKFRVKDNDK